MFPRFPGTFRRPQCPHPGSRRTSPDGGRNPRAKRVRPCRGRCRGATEGGTIAPHPSQAEALRLLRHYTRGRGAKQAVCLVANNDSAEPYVARLQGIEADMAAENTPPYNPTAGTNFTIPGGLPYPDFSGANSNSWARELIERAGWKGAYERAIAKKGGAPWVPGWRADRWPAR